MCIELGGIGKCGLFKVIEGYDDEEDEFEEVMLVKCCIIKLKLVGECLIKVVVLVKKVFVKIVVKKLVIKCVIGIGKIVVKMVIKMVVKCVLVKKCVV